MTTALDPVPYRAATHVFDEAVAPGGEWRRSWRDVVGLVGGGRPGELVERRRQADRLLDAEGAGHLVHELAFERWFGSAPSTAPPRRQRIDPLPLVLDTETFHHLARGVAQRMRGLEALVADLHGARRAVAAGWLPGRVLYGAPGMRNPPTGTQQRWLVVCALDVVRTADGSWRLVGDDTDAPASVGDAFLHRAVMGRLVLGGSRASIRPVAPFADAMRDALAAHAPRGRRSPRTVVLTSGPGHPAYVEHSYLSMLLGFHLAERGDLVVREGRVWLRALEGLEPVDVVLRRVRHAELDPLVAAPGGRGVPGMTWAAQRGGVALANAFGSHVVSEPDLAPWVDAAVEHLIGESLLLPRLGSDDRLATTPVHAGAGADAVVPGNVLLRVFAVASPTGVTVLDGGVARVLAPGDAPHQPTSQLVKDVWIVGDDARPARLALRAPPPPQVDLGASVPKRSADALHWMGRSAERAEVAARLVRLLRMQLALDPALRDVGDGGWARGAVALLRAAQGVGLGAPQSPAAGAVGDALAGELDAAQATVASQLGVLVQEAISVREYLSSTTGRVLGHLARLRADLLGGEAAADDLDVVLVDLAAVAGLATESTVRGPAWRFLDLGRRIERALAVLGSVEAGLGAVVDPLAFQPLAEAVLGANESLTAYRRQYRSDVELTAVIDLLVHDDANPRSLAFQLDRMREHVASLAWPEGGDLVQRASVGAMRALDDVVANGRRLAVDALVVATRGPLLDLGDAIAQRWFADPVHPTVMGPA